MPDFVPDFVTDLVPDFVTDLVPDFVTDFVPGYCKNTEDFTRENYCSGGFF